MSNRLILVGSGSFGRELINWAYDTCMPFSSYIGSPGTLEGYSYDLQHLGEIDDYCPSDGDSLVIAIGDPLIKKSIATKLKSKGAKFKSLIHPSAVIAKSAVLGEGCVICPQAVISADSKISDFVAVNALSSVGHDAVVGCYSTLSAHVDLTGFVAVGECVFFGTGAKVLPKVEIGSNAKIGAGSLVMRNVSEGSVMYALPAKKL